MELYNAIGQPRHRGDKCAMNVSDVGAMVSVLIPRVVGAGALCDFAGPALSTFVDVLTKRLGIHRSCTGVAAFYLAVLMLIVA